MAASDLLRLSSLSKDKKTLEFFTLLEAPNNPAKLSNPGPNLATFWTSNYSKNDVEQILGTL